MTYAEKTSKWGILNKTSSEKNPSKSKPSPSHPIPPSDFAITGHWIWLLLGDKVGDEIRLVRTHRQDLALGQVCASVIGWKGGEILVCPNDDLSLETHHHVAGDVAVEQPHARVERLPAHDSPT